MSRVSYYCAASLDGYIAEGDDTLGWLLGYEGSYAGPDAQPIAGAYERFYEGVGALVMGSTTYEWIVRELEAWPYAGKPTWVLTTRELAAPDARGADVRMTRGRVADLAGEMIAAAGERALWVVGGGNVASQFADEGLIDEVIVTLVPVVLGEGKPLFDRRLPGGPMRLTGTRPFDSGMVEVRYEVVRTG